jgi:hypothetical protein
MDAKHRFREGWIMLLRPFSFGDIPKPIQKLTILYAFAEKPTIETELNDRGKELYEELLANWGKENGLTKYHRYKKNRDETSREYEYRLQEEERRIFDTYSKVEHYKGEVVQARISGKACRFFPGEYSIVSKETISELLVCGDSEYIVDIENKHTFDSILNLDAIKDKIFYIRSRGIPKSRALKMIAEQLKDSIIFRPQPALLEMFCRENEIY